MASVSVDTQWNTVSVSLHEDTETTSDSVSVYFERDQEANRVIVTDDAIEVRFDEQTVSLTYDEFWNAAFLLAKSGVTLV